MEDRFYIQDYDESSGLRRDKRPFLIPDKAFALLENMYQWRGLVRKRFGSRWMGDTQLQSRLRVNIGTTDGSGNFVGTTPQLGGSPIVPGAMGQMFSIGTTVFTVFLNAPTNMFRSDGSADPATYAFATGAVNIVGADINETVYFYPALPVMGLPSFETGVNNFDPFVAFDQSFSYKFAGGFERISGETNPGDARWTGDNAQFFWADTWISADASEAGNKLFVTNFNPAEPNYMRYLDATLTTWTTFRPALNSTDFLDSARILVVFKNSLNAFNTWETRSGIQQNYPARGEWAAIGDPTAADAWRQDIPGKGNFLDAPTTQAITTVEFVKDRLIVFFERSTYEWVYRSNSIYPYAWQKINTELGVESTFSVIPMDKVAIGVGNVGIFASNGTSVERIDNSIPDEVFKIHNTNGGIDRVHGIRDYFVEMLYWTFPSSDASADFPYPNRVLVYNYDKGTWSFNDDSFTCFGYFQSNTGVTWDSTTVTWDDVVSWDSGFLSAQFRNVIAGNQEGYIVIVDPECPVNAPALQITTITVGAQNRILLRIVDHNLRLGDLIYLQDIVGTGNLILLNGKIFVIEEVVDSDQVIIVYRPISVVIAGTYQGNGVVSRTSVPNILTKSYNFYSQRGNNAAISKVDFLVDRTDTGQLLVNWFVSSANIPMYEAGVQTGSQLGTSVLETTPYTLYPLERNQARLWHPVYINAEGEVITLQITLSDEQMLNPDVRIAPITLHAMCIYAQETGRFQ